MFEVLLAIIAIGIAGFAWYAVTARRRQTDLQAQSQQKLGQLRSEHEKRVERMRRKFSDVEARGHLDFAADLLPALDALGQALAESGESADIDALREGLEMVDRELVSVLRKHGIEVVSPCPGDAFDPNVHEAVTIVESEDFEAGSVAECFRPGYVHEDRVLRAAAVAVTKQAVTKQAAVTSQDADYPEHAGQADDREPDEVSPEAVDDEELEGSPETGSSSRL